MIKISGQLIINTRTDRNGDFNIGHLVTDFDEFSVKDKMLDLYDAGKYDGKFVIAQIKPSYYSYGTHFVVETCAYIDLELSTVHDNSVLSDDDKESFNSKESDPIVE